MSDQKLVLEIEVVFNGDGITSSKDCKAWLADWVQQVGAKTNNIRHIDGKVIEHSPNGKQKEIIAYANYKPTYDEDGVVNGGEINAMTTTEKFCIDNDMTREQIERFCERNGMRLANDA